MFLSSKHANYGASFVYVESGLVESSAIEDAVEVIVGRLN